MECRFLVQHVLMKFTALFTATLDRAWILLDHFVHYQCNLTGVISLPKRQLKRKKRQKTNWSFHFANFHASWFLLCFNSCFSAEEVLMHINMLIRSVFSLDVSNVLTLSTSSCETASRNYQRFVKSPVTMFFSITSIDCWWLCRSTNIVLWSCLFTILIPHW